MIIKLCNAFIITLAVTISIFFFKSTVSNKTMSSSRPYDVIVWGATGFTGKLTSSYLAANYPDLRWAIGGRNEKKLQDVKAELKLSCSVEVVADINDREALDSMVRKCKVVIATAGPFALCGSPIIESCIRCISNYCDITGEVQWVRMMIDKYEKQAIENKVKIVNCCGLDCIPCDIGCNFVCQEMEKRGFTPTEVRLTCVNVKGGVSGGTVYSMANLFESSTNKELMELQSPFFLNPKNKSNGQLEHTQDPTAIRKSNDSYWFNWDDIEKRYVMPYIMQSVDTRIVNRSYALLGSRYGERFNYSERMASKGFLMSLLTCLISPFVLTLLYFKFTRKLLLQFAPSPGNGPSQEILKNGYIFMNFWARGINNATKAPVLFRAGFSAKNGDPGYQQTAKFVGEAGVCLALDYDKLPKKYGMLTPSVAMGSTLQARLQAKEVDFFVIKD